MEYCKLQAGCFILVFYIIFIYIREKRIYIGYKRESLFETLLAVGTISIFLDGVTAYTVNHLQEIPLAVNLLLHLLFLLSLDAIMFVMFWYLLALTDKIPENKAGKNMIKLPFVLNVLIVIGLLPQLSFCEGEWTNYSMGISAYSAFVMVAIYAVAASGIFLRSFRRLRWREKITISTYLFVSIAIALYQMFFPEALITCLVPTLVILGTYLNQENPLFTKLRRHHEEMVMGFATLVENRDDSTGQHIYRTTAYVKFLAEKLWEKGFYREILTKDYIEKLVTAAPLHDIGKIAIPDTILQKPGKLTAEEFEMMKIHAAKGGAIIRETFGKEDEISYEVAMYHHERWNGSGYPQGLSRKEIPLCARIMAIADVFDAVSSKRCYKEAFPLSECFDLIERGSGQDFDPVAAEVFLEYKEAVTNLYLEFQNNKISK